MSETSSTFRDLIRQISPRWLQGFWGQRFLYALGLHFDGLGDSVTAGVKMGMPGAYAPDSLPLLGRQRRMRRGLSETDASYGNRLAGWWDYHKRRGSPVVLLEQLRTWFAATPFKVEYVLDAPVTARRGWQLDVDGSITQTAPRLWNWDGDATKPTRFWLIFHAENVWQSEGVWTDPGIWGDGGTIGTTASPDEVASIQGLVFDTRPPHAECENIIIVYDDALWNAQQPDGTWNLWSNRNPNAAYWNGG